MVDTVIFAVYVLPLFVVCVLIRTHTEDCFVCIAMLYMMTMSFEDPGLTRFVLILLNTSEETIQTQSHLPSGFPIGKSLAL